MATKYGDKHRNNNNKDKKTCHKKNRSCEPDHKHVMLNKLIEPI